MFDTAYFISVHLLVYYTSVNISGCMDMDIQNDIAHLGSIRFLG